MEAGGGGCPAVAGGTGARVAAGPADCLRWLPTGMPQFPQKRESAVFMKPQLTQAWYCGIASPQSSHTWAPWRLP